MLARFVVCAMAMASASVMLALQVKIVLCKVAPMVATVAACVMPRRTIHACAKRVGGDRRAMSFSVSDSRWRRRGMRN